ncbi:ABC transporter permease [Pseudofrankia sp. DC12]|uniref:ABC transporter permease n=1 Tax=Pseudofrankia sp. DC12 TaxID=683315 RepID=UPI0009FC8893|nr:ABC transporter permease [Pseudofrankia sp. DC12]
MTAITETAAIAAPVPADAAAGAAPSAAAARSGARPVGRVQFGALTARLLRSLLRRPAFVAITLVQAVVWLPLFGSLFRSVATVPGFGAGDYIDYLTPGVATMSVLFSAGWTGIRFIDDMENGVMERLLASPTRRWAVVGGTVAHEAVIVAVQVTLVVLLGWALGAHLRSGVPGVLVLIVVAVTLSTAVAALSDALALVVRRREALIAAANFLVLPLTFLSTAMMPAGLLPGWIRAVAHYNPANWAVIASRGAIAADPDWVSVGWNLLGLVALAGLAWAVAVRAFRGYQRSL